MSKKQKNESQIQGLVVFKGRLAQIKANETEAVPKSEGIDQEYKIKLLSELGPFGAFYKYSVIFLNESSAPITEIRAKLYFPDSFLLTRHYPSTIVLATSNLDSGEAQVSFEIDNLNGNSNQKINFYLTPEEINVEGKFLTAASYINNKGFIRTLSVESLLVKSKPFRYRQKEIPSEEIGEFLRKEAIKRGIKRIGVGVKKKPNLDLYFNHTTQLIKLHNFKLIAKDEKNRIAWFFASELVSNEDVLVIGQIVANKVEFLAASKNNSILVSLLTNLSNDFKKSISSTGIVASDQIYNLECKFCGNILPSFPKKGASIECLKCNNEQVVW